MMFLTNLLWYSMGYLIQIYLITATVNCEVMMAQNRPLQKIIQHAHELSIDKKMTLSILQSLIQKSVAHPTMYKIPQILCRKKNLFTMESHSPVLNQVQSKLPFNTTYITTSTNRTGNIAYLLRKSSLSSWKILSSIWR